jgi:large subunit ribosomal protein L24
MKIRRGDEVLVLTGKDQGESGRVRRAFPRENRVLVEGVNMVKRHMKPGGQARQTGIIRREAPIHVSNLMLICPKCQQPTRIGYRLLEDGSRSRVCKKCHGLIDEVTE